MSNYIKLINNLEVLQLEKIKQNLDQYVDLINNKKKDVVESLYELTNLEIELRNENNEVLENIKKYKSNLWLCKDSRISVFKNIWWFWFFISANIK